MREIIKKEAGHPFWGVSKYRALKEENPDPGGGTMRRPNRRLAETTLQKRSGDRKGGFFFRTPVGRFKTISLG